MKNPLTIVKDIKAILEGATALLDIIPGLYALARDTAKKARSIIRRVKDRLKNRRKA